jgi:hypothetical protein
MGCSTTSDARRKKIFAFAIGSKSAAHRADDRKK